MSSNIRIKRICEYCGQEFLAKTTVTKYCNHKCNSRAYKAKVKGEKIKVSNKETHKTKHQTLETVKSKEFLNVRETSVLLGLSIRTVYRLIDSGTINAVNLGDRLTRINRSYLNHLFEPPKKKAVKEIRLKFEDCYKLSEVRNKYQLSESVLYSLVKRNNVPTIRRGKEGYVPKQIIDELLT